MGDFLRALVENLPLVLCMLVGAGLLVAEIFMPGFGLAGFSGVVLLGAGIAITWNAYGVLAGLIVTLAALVLIGVSVSISIRSATKGKIAKSALFLNSEVPPQEHEELESFRDKRGVTLTVLNPVGIADFDGVRLNVTSEGNYLEKGRKVQVIRIEGTHIIVREIEAQGREKKS